MTWIALPSLDRSGLPLQGAELRQEGEVPLIRREHGNAGASCTGSNQRIIGAAPVQFARIHTSVPTGQELCRRGSNR
jgi:hypothetical protein